MVLENLIPNDYLRAFILLVVLLFAIRVLLFVLEKAVLSITRKTKTELDDLLVKKLSKPLTFLAFLVSLLVSANELTFTENIASIVSNFIFSLMFITIAYISYVIVDVVVIRAIEKVARKTKSTIDDSLVSLFHGVLKAALIVISILYILAIWGVQITPLLAGLGIAGLAIALALQPVLSNIFSGISMILDKTIRVNDLVYLDTIKGKIERVGLRSTRIRTFDNELIIVPNNKLAESIIQNIALPEPKSRVVIPFGVAYGSNIEKVKKIVLIEIKKIKSISKEPAPLVRFREMADSSLNFKAYFHVDSYEDRFAAIDEANTKIYNALNKAGISIPFPQMDVHLKKE